MADPRHPVRDNSRALGLVSDRTASTPGQSQEPSAETGDDFARALDAALDAIRTAIDDDDEAEKNAAAEQPFEPEQDPGWTMPNVTAPQNPSREQRAFREISSDIAARHPELRGAPEAPKQEPRSVPMPNAATLASRAIPSQRAREPMSYDPYSPMSGAGARRAAPTATIPANDEPDLSQRPYRVGGASVDQGGQDDYWARFANEVDSDLVGANEQPRSRSPMQHKPAVRTAPTRATPRSRAMQPNDLPSFGNNHDDAPAKSSGKGRVLAVSAIALVAALGFAAVAVWLGNELSSQSGDGDINIAASPAVSEQRTAAALPAANSNNPARLQVSPAEGRAGEAIPLDVSLTAAPGERTAVLISGLPADSKLSSGVDTGKGVWIVKPGDLDGLELTAPQSASGNSDMKFELVASNGLTLDVQTAQLTLEADEAQVALRSEPVVAAGLTPKPVKTAAVTFGQPAPSPVASTQDAAAEPQVSAPPLAPRAQPPAAQQSAGGGGGGQGWGGGQANVQVVDRQSQSGEPGQNVAKSQTGTQPAAKTVRLASINPAPTSTATNRIATPQPLPPEMQELVQRGNALMEIGDLASARLFFERAAEAGSADAALSMAKSFDPIYFEEKDVHGLPANPDRAMQWYEKAAGLGSAEASTRLSALKARL